jgi:hypothetical protein
MRFVNDWLRKYAAKVLTMAGFDDSRRKKETLVAVFQIPTGEKGTGYPTVHYNVERKGIWAKLNSSRDLMK